MSGGVTSASRTSSSLKGLITAITSFMAPSCSFCGGRRMAFQDPCQSAQARQAAMDGAGAPGGCTKNGQPPGCDAGWRGSGGGLD